MQALFTTLTHAIEGTPAIAMAAAFTWGILSILLSPCHLASIPLIVGFIDDQGHVSTRRAFFMSSLFAVGILITIGLIGAVTALAGRMMGDMVGMRTTLLPWSFSLQDCTCWMRSPYPCKAWARLTSGAGACGLPSFLA